MNPITRLADNWEQIELKRRHANLERLINQVITASPNSHLGPSQILGDAARRLREIQRQIKTPVTRILDGMDPEISDDQMDLF